VEQRLLELAEIFAVGVYAYAVMSNHLHVVTYVNPGVACGWSAEDVAARWVRLFPIHTKGELDEEANRHRAEAMAGNAERIAVCRARLASLSWFMRCLSEPIARRANREDACSGRFWGRILLLQFRHSSHPCASRAAFAARRCWMSQPSSPAWPMSI
jgi:hypothetical protein